MKLVEGIEIMSTLIPVFFQTQQVGQRSWVEIKEKWKTDVRKLMIEMETQAPLKIINKKKYHCLKKYENRWNQKVRILWRSYFYSSVFKIV